MAELAWEDAASAFALYLLTASKSQATITTYAYNVRFFWRRLHASGLSALTASVDDVAGFLAARAREVSANKLHQDLMAIRAFYKCAIARAWRHDDPTEGMSLPTEETAPEPPYSNEEVAALLNACRSERDRLMLLLLFSTGMRIGEFVDMHISDLNWTAGQILVRGKGAKQRWLAPEPFVIKRLRMFTRQTKGFVWLTKYKTRLSEKVCRANLDVIATKAQVLSAHPHRFRSTFAVRMIEAGVGLQSLQVMLGHESIVTTERYARWGKVQRAMDDMLSFNPAKALAG